MKVRQLTTRIAALAGLAGDKMVSLGDASYACACLTNPHPLLVTCGGLNFCLFFLFFGLFSLSFFNCILDKAWTGRSEFQRCNSPIFPVGGKCRLMDGLNNWLQRGFFDLYKNRYTTQNGTAGREVRVAGMD
jgi:hypothetical protein